MHAVDSQARDSSSLVTSPTSGDTPTGASPASTDGRTAAMIGEELYRAGAFAEASQILDQAVQGSPVSKSDVLLVRALNRIGASERAREHARFIAASNEGDPVSRARVLEAVGDRAAALEQLHEHARQQGPSGRAIWQALADMTLASRDWGAAWAVIKDADSRGVRSERLGNIREQIERAARSTDTHLELCASGQFKGEFLSTESMLRAIVDRVLCRPSLELVEQSTTSGEIGHIVLVISSLGAGGGERQAVNLANSLVADSRVTRVTLLCSRLGEQRNRFYLAALDSRVHVDAYYDATRKLSPDDVPSLARFADLLEHIQPSSRLQVLLQLAERLERERADAVEGWMDETFINVALTCAMLGHRSSVAGHWVNVPPEEACQPDDLKREKARYLYRAYREIIRLPGLRYSSNSALNGQAYARWLDLPVNAVATIHNGICEKALADEASTGPGCRKLLHIPTDALVVGSIMRLVEQKRPLLWIDVAARLAASRPDLHFVLLGEGGLRDEVEAYVHKLGLRNVHVCGNRKNVGAWLVEFDVFLLTSRIEGVPNAAVEAQLSGCPVVAQAVGGLAEIVDDGKTGLLLSDDDPDVIAQAVLRVLSCPHLHSSLVDAARLEARQRHSLSGLKEAHFRLHCEAQYTRVPTDAE